jgi:hypothetical protein
MTRIGSTAVTFAVLLLVSLVSFCAGLAYYHGSHWGLFGDRYRMVAHKRGVISRDDPFTFRVHLERGVQYRFGARCAEDCDDVLMALLDPRGQWVDIDTDLDEPKINFRPNATGDYTIRLGWNVGHDDRRQLGVAVRVASKRPASEA